MSYNVRSVRGRRKMESQNSSKNFQSAKAASSTPRSDKNALTSSKKLSKRISLLGMSSTSKKKATPNLVGEVSTGNVLSTTMVMEEINDENAIALTKEKTHSRQSVAYNNYGFDEENYTPIAQKPSVIVTSPTPDYASYGNKNVFAYVDDIEETSLPVPPSPPPATHLEIEIEKTDANESLKSHSCREHEETYTSAQTLKLGHKTPDPRDSKLVTTRDTKFGVTTSNQRRYSSVVAELVGKRDSLVAESINPSLVLSYQADLASPDGFSYVSFPSNTSDDSYDKKINFSPDPLRTEERPVNQTYNIYRDPTQSDQISKSVPHGEMVAINTSKQLSKESDERKSVAFLDGAKMKKGDSTYTSVSLYPSQDFLSCYSGENEKSTSTPVDSYFPRQLSFNQVSGGSSIPNIRESQMTGPTDMSRSPDKSNKSKIFRSPKSPLRHRGSYTVPQSPECVENMDRKNAQRRKIGIIFIIIGIILYIISFIGWFVILPYVEREK